MSDIRPKVSEKIDQLIHEIVEMHTFINSIDCHKKENQDNGAIFLINESNCLLLMKLASPNYVIPRAEYLLDNEDFESFKDQMLWHHQNNCEEKCCDQ